MELQDFVPVFMFGIVLPMRENHDFRPAIPANSLACMNSNSSVSHDAVETV
jgi:hypothetical protein